MRPMTRARAASSGMGSLAAIQPLLGAVLMLCVSLVQAAATTLRMILNRRRPDWHRQATDKDLPQATSGNHTKDPSGLGSILSLAPQQAQTLLPRQGGGAPRTPVATLAIRWGSAATGAAHAVTP